MDALLEPHHQATIDRIRHESVVLVSQDTSSLCYTIHPEMQGIGPISNRVNGPQGLLVHSALAFRPDGLPLGILDIECWARDPGEFGKRKQCNAKPIEIKESFKWIRALTPIGNAAALPVERRRCDHFTTLETLTSKSVAVSRQVRPLATAWATRSRRSFE